MGLVFLFGSLLDDAVRGAVLPGAVAVGFAELPGFCAVQGPGGGAGLVAQDGGALSGLLVDLEFEDEARLHFYVGCFRAVAQGVTLVQDGALYMARCFGPEDVATGEVWTQDNWTALWAATMRRAVPEIMGFYGQRDVHAMRRSVGSILVRASSWVRAQAEEVPQFNRYGYEDNDVEVEAQRAPYVDFFAMEEQDIRFRRFDGDFSDTVQRAAFVSGDAVTVLPYDPVRDRVLVIEQFRFGPLVRGDKRPWSLEPIAGRIDPGETPEVCAHREAWEETELRLTDLLPIANYYPSPGAMSEYLYSYVGLADLPDEAAKIGGLEAEAEDIRGVLLSFDALMEMIQSGEAQNGPLILSAYWLKSERARLHTNA